MTNDDMDLKPQVVRNNKGSNEFLKTVTINIISTVLLCIIFTCANFIIQTNLLNSKLASINGVSDDASAMDDEDTEQVKHGVIVDLGDFVLNLADENQRRYLKTNIALEITQAESEETTTEGAKKEGEHGGEEAAPAQTGLEKKLAEYNQRLEMQLLQTCQAKLPLNFQLQLEKNLQKNKLWQQ